MQTLDWLKLNFSQTKNPQQNCRGFIGEVI